MTRVDHADRPRPERKPLPSKEQIDTISDIPALEAMETEVERRAKKIEVDLEFEVGDAEWDGRARGALAAHRICLGDVRKRLHWLRVREKPETVTAPEVIRAKAEKARASAEKHKALAAATDAARANKQAKVQQGRLDLIERTTFQGFFMRSAAQLLDQETYDRIFAHAQARHRRTIEAQLPDSVGPVKKPTEAEETP